jgi:hypothetical protein
MTSTGADATTTAAVSQAAAIVLQGTRLQVGTLQEVGHAPYRNDPDNKESPFVKVQTATGERTVWGVDLPRALDQADAKVGDTIALEYRGARPVAVDVLERDAAGKIVGQSPAAVDRNSWFAVKLVDLPAEAERAALAERVGLTGERGAATVTGTEQVLPNARSAQTDPQTSSPVPGASHRQPASPADANSRAQQAPATMFATPPIAKPPITPNAEWPREMEPASLAARQVRSFMNGADPGVVDRAATHAAVIASGERAIVGKVVEAATAHYLHEPRNAKSPYVVLETSAGRETVWGADLPRAFREAGMRIGDAVLLAQLGAAAVTVGKAEHDAQGRAVGERPEPSLETRGSRSGSPILQRPKRIGSGRPRPPPNRRRQAPCKAPRRRRVSPARKRLLSDPPHRLKASPRRSTTVRSLAPSSSRSTSKACPKVSVNR